MKQHAVILDDTGVVIKTITRTIPNIRTVVLDSTADDHPFDLENTLYEYSEETGEFLETPRSSASAVALAKANKALEISDNFEQELQEGHYMSEVIGIEVDLRRGHSKNDLQNVANLLAYMERKSMETIEYVGYSETKIITFAELQSLQEEMQERGLGLYQKKWTLLNTVSNAATVEDIDQIAW